MKKNILVIEGERGTGKSLAAQDLMISRSFGGKWLDLYDVPQGEVLLVDGQNPDLDARLSHVFAGRIGDFDRMKENQGQILALRGKDLDLDLKLLRQIWKENQWLIIDPLWKMEEMADLSQDEVADVYDFYRTLDEMARQRKAVLALVVYPEDPLARRLADILTLHPDAAYMNGRQIPTGIIRDSRKSR